MEQVVHLPDGRVAKVSRQQPPQASYRALDITENLLTYQHEYTNGSPTGERFYTVTRSYTRHGDTLLVVPAPGIPALPLLIHLLTDQQLVLRSVPRHNPGEPYTEWKMTFGR